MSDEPGPFRSIDAVLVTIGKRADLSAKGNQRKVSALHKRRMARLEGRGRAAAVIDPLPAPGECLHLAINGTYSGWAVALAIADLITAPIDHLTISTLGFHRDNADDLIAWLDTGKVRGATLNVSTYFRSSDADIFESIHRDMTQRGQRVKVTRLHAKLLLFDAGPQAIVVETSANLRSSQNWEQASIFDSRELLEFHRTWIDDLHEESHR